MNIGKVIAEELELKEWQVEKAIELIDEGNTIPFISRYRKEVTGSLNDEQLDNTLIVISENGIDKEEFDDKNN